MLVRPTLTKRPSRRRPAAVSQTICQTGRHGGGGLSIYPRGAAISHRGSLQKFFRKSCGCFRVASAVHAQVAAPARRASTVTPVGGDWQSVEPTGRKNPFQACARSPRRVLRSTARSGIMDAEGCADCSRYETDFAAMSAHQFGQQSY